MEQSSENNLISDWTDLICDFSQQGYSVAIGIFNTNGQLLDANQAMCYFLDTTRSPLNPKNQFINPDFSFFLSEEHNDLVFEGLMTIGNYADISYVLSAKVFRRKDRILVYAEADVFNLFEQNMKMSTLNQEVNNLQRQLIKEKKNLQAALDGLNLKTIELEALNSMLSELNIEKNNYIGMVAHDLRNPIGIAESFTEILIEELDNLSKETQLEYLTHITNNCSFSLGLIRDFLNISKIESGIFDLNASESEYVSFVKASIVYEEILAKSKSQEIIITTGVSNIYACFDKNKIQQVLNNLLGNAIKFSFPHTKIVIEISETETEIITKISDQGQGIPAEELSKIFNPFQTSSVKSTANEKSTGLGLAIVKKIVEAHHGWVKVESEVGKGSSFYFSIPRQIEINTTDLMI